MVPALHKTKERKMIRYFRSILTNPSAYQLWWKMVGGPGQAKVLVEQYIQPKAGSRILEIGCGPGTIYGYLPTCDYLGFDLSSKYIELAKRRFPEGRFVCERVSRFAITREQSFDVVLALGIVHHLEDPEARQLFQIAYDALRPGGKLITIDGVWVDDQSSVARWLLARDRGTCIRQEREYLEIASHVFSDIRPNVRHDLLRIPYTHLILECVR
jgi:SAM-dependent methyltransferase